MTRKSKNFLSKQNNTQIAISALYGSCLYLTGELTKHKPLNASGPVGHSLITIKYYACNATL